MDEIKITLSNLTAEEQERWRKSEEKKDRIYPPYTYQDAYKVKVKGIVLFCPRYARIGELVKAIKDNLIKVR